MLHEAIRLGCEIYHDGVTSEYDNGYTQYLDDKDQLKWDCPDRLDILEIEKLRVFLNEKWRARIQMEDKGRDLIPISCNAAVFSLIGLSGFRPSPE